MKPKQAGFDIFKGGMHAAINSYWNYEYLVQDDTTPADQWRSEPMPTKSLPGIAPTNYAPVVKAANAIEWIQARHSQDPDKPWFRVACIQPGAHHYHSAAERHVCAQCRYA